MYNESEILNLVADVSAVNKAYDRKTDNKGDETPKYSENYVKAVEYMEAIEPHAEYGEFPHQLFRKRSPNQTEEEMMYIKENFKQVTLPVFQDFINTLSRAFNDNNWNIKFDDTNDGTFPDESFQKYCENLPVYGSIYNWLKFVLPAIKIKDANGFVVTKPYNLELLELEDGSTVINPDSMINPIPYYYDSEQVIKYEENEFILYELEEKSLVDYQGALKRKGRIYEFVDKMNIYQVVQVGKFIDYKFEVRLVFPHNLERLPCKVLNGIPVITEDGIIYQSPFLYAVDLLDLVLMNYSYLQASINKCVYPYRVMLGDVCDFEKDGIHCDGGWLMSFEGNRTQCPNCKGSGLLSRVSPIGELLLKPQSRTDQGDSNMSEPLKYVAPDTKVLEYLDNKITQDENRARHILHMKTSQSQVKGNENVTATDAAIDQKAMYSFIQTISDQIFDIFEYTLNCMGEMRYGEYYLPVSVTYPKSFDLETESDLMLKISEAIKAGLPTFVIHAIVYKYIQSLYYTDKKTSNVFELIVETDRLLTLNNDEIAMKIARGTADKWEDVLHTSAYQLINLLVDANPNFFTQDMKVQKEQLITAAKEVAAGLTSSKPATDIINTLVP